MSKATLYVYFDSKERLFEAIAHEACLAQAQQIFALDPADHDVEAVLTRLGREFVKFFCRPGAMSPLRTVISISERMPEIGQGFLRNGPAKGAAAFRGYLESRVAAGTLAIDDCEVAAAQFLDSCVATIFQPLLLTPSTRRPRAHRPRGRHRGPRLHRRLSVHYLRLLGSLCGEVAVTPRLRPLSKPSDLAARRPKRARSGSDLAGRGFIAPALMPSMKLRLAPRRS